MKTNKPEVQRYDDMGCPEQICRVDTMHKSEDGDYVLYEDYEALHAECEKLRTKTSVTLGVGDGSGMLFVHGDYDSIKRVQALIFECEHLRKDAERYRYIRKGNQWVVAATQAGFQLGEGDLDDLIDAEMEQKI